MMHGASEVGQRFAGKKEGGVGPVGYASDRNAGLSATPATSPIGVDGVADRWGGRSTA